MKKNPFKTFATGLSLLLLFTTSAFASEQYVEHAAKTEILNEMMSSNPENGSQVLGDNLEEFSAILAKYTKDRVAQDTAEPFARRDAATEFITVSTGQNALFLTPGVTPVPFDTVEKTRPGSSNKLSLVGPGILFGNSGTYLIMYSMGGNFRNTIVTSPTPNIAALYPSVSPPSTLAGGQGVIGPINTKTTNSAGTTLLKLGGSGVSNNFIADFSDGDVLELLLNNDSPTDTIVAEVGGFLFGVVGPCFSMTVIRLY
ncbi:MAG: hypothetical protein KR126chlam1_00537 [Chlamydiae bacterium]|nr:hypothetical protein [Chlamydiota bacterium]